MSPLDTATNAQLVSPIQIAAPQYTGGQFDKSGFPDIDYGDNGFPRMISRWDGPLSSMVGVGKVPLEIVVIKIRDAFLQKGIFLGPEHRKVLAKFFHQFWHPIIDPILYGTGKHSLEEQQEFCRVLWGIIAQFDTPIGLPYGMGKHMILTVLPNYKELAIRLFIPSLSRHFWLMKEDIMAGQYTLDSVPFGGTFWRYIQAGEGAES